MGEISQGEFFMHLLVGDIQSPQINPKYIALTFFM